MNTIYEVFEWAKSKVEEYHERVKVARQQFHNREIAHYELVETLECAQFELEESLSDRMEYLGSGLYSQAYAFSTPEMEYVLKFTKSGENIKVPSKKFLKEHPLLDERYLKPVINIGAIMVQPKADTVPEDEWRENKKMNYAANWLARKLRELYNDDFDCHGGNIGFFNRKIMIFDPLVY